MPLPPVFARAIAGWSAADTKATASAAVLLGAHGAGLLLFGGASTAHAAWQWALIALFVTLGVSTLLLPPSLRPVGLWTMLAATFALLALTGGVASFYTLWLFLLLPVAAMALPGSQVIAFVSIGSAGYIALHTLSSTSLPVAVLLGRAVVLFGTGVIVGYVNWLREEDRKAVRALLASRDHFLSSVAHGLRTPLTTVLGLSELLVDSPDDTAEDLEELTVRIRDEAARVALLIEDLTVAERSGEGLLAFRPTTFSALDAVDAVIRDPLVAVRTPSITVGGNDTMALADRERTHQLLRHLIENALDHGGSHIRVDVGTEQGATTIAVRDDGPGAPDAYTATPDAPFHVDPAEPVGLRGLGLYVAHALAARMDGSIRYDRTEGWTAFTLVLPAG